MATIGEKLKTAREEKGISIDDIAVATHINKKYLVDLENDVQLKLPQTYVRAFLRSFAFHVGLDPDELLKPPPPPPPPTTPPSAPESQARPQPEVKTYAPPPESPRYPPQTPETPIKQHQFKALFALSAIIVVGLVVLIVFLQQQRDSTTVKEVSFPDVIKEQQTEHPPAALPADSSAHPPAVPRAKTLDSLTLEAVSVDTVWLSILIDSTTTRQYTLPPQHRMKWKALRSFLVTAGDGGSVYITLNGTHLGTLGQKDKPVKNFLMTRELLQPREKSAGSTKSDEKP